MDKRFWIPGVVLGLCAALGVYSCQRDPQAQGKASQAAITADGPTSNIDDQPTASAANAAAAEAQTTQRNDAMYVVVATLQRYLAAVGGQDWAKADPLWSNDQPPAQSGEADLRTLADLQALRIQNGTPKALDAEPVPNALEIPVQLRASFKHGGGRRYEGWYRLRRNVADGSWEITSASISVQPR